MFNLQTTHAVCKVEPPVFLPPVKANNPAVGEEVKLTLQGTTEGANDVQLTLISFTAKLACFHTDTPSAAYTRSWLNTPPLNVIRLFLFFSLT